MIEYYDSPINLFKSLDLDRIAEKIGTDLDNRVVEAVVNTGIYIDKEKLVSILMKDKKRYEEAFKKGYDCGYDRRDSSIIRCRDCKHNHIGFGCELMHRPFDKHEDWYCADGEKQECEEED